MALYVKKKSILPKQPAGFVRESMHSNLCLLGKQGLAFQKSIVDDFTALKTTKKKTNSEIIMVLYLQNINSIQTGR